MRKLGLLFAVAVMAMAFGATAASAVTVENPGANEITSELGLTLGQHTPNFEPGLLFCDNHWTGTVSSSAEIHLDSIDIDDHEGAVGNCEAMDECGEWSGQIVEDTDGPYEYEVNFDFCLVGAGGGIDGLNPIETHCEITDISMHCDASTAYFDHPLVGPIPVGELNGEASIEEPLGLTHH